MDRTGIKERAQISHDGLPVLLRPGCQSPLRVYCLNRRKLSRSLPLTLKRLGGGELQEQILSTRVTPFHPGGTLVGMPFGDVLQVQP